jgi:hypothetical protein
VIHVPYWSEANHPVLPQLLAVDERNYHSLLTTQPKHKILCASSGAGLGGVQLSLTNRMHDFYTREDLLQILAEQHSGTTLKCKIATKPSKMNEYEQKDEQVGAKGEPMVAVE